MNLRDELALHVLRTAEYGALVRVVLMRDCRRKPELVDAVPACSKLTSITPEAIERLLLPHFNRYVTEDQARAALDFWSAPLGSGIKRKLLAGIAEGDATTLTPEENGALARFNASEAGLAMGRLAQDQAVSREIIRAIGEFEV